MLSLLLGTASFAQQVPEGGFETWGQRNGAEAPQGWITTDDVLLEIFGLPLNSGSVSKSTDRRSGSFAAKLETTALPLMGGVLPGAVFVGNRFNITGFTPGGVPLTGRPANLQFYYKLTGPGAAIDSAQVSVQLTKSVGGITELVADAEMYLLTPAATYTQLVLPLTYYSSLGADSVRIYFSSGEAVDPLAGTALYIDDVSMTGVVTPARERQVTSALTVFPNPSADGRFTLSAQQEPALHAAFSVTDATGRVVLRQPASTALSSATRVVDLHGRPAGVYTLRLHGPAGPVVRRLLVR